MSAVIVFSGSVTQADYTKAILQANGIPCWFENAAMARIVPHHFAAGVQAVKVAVAPSDAERACELLQDSLSEVPAEPWICPHCNEEIEGQFAQCWSCGNVQPESENSVSNGST